MQRFFFYIILFFCCWPFLSKAQLADMRLRANAGVAFEPTKRIGLTARYRLTTYQNAVVFYRSMFSVNASYRIMKDWEAGAEYRYNTSYDKDFHRYFLYTRVKYGIGDFDISYRVRYQQQQDYFDNDYLARFPADRVFRNRLMLKYACNKKTDYYIYADHFTELKNKQILPYRVRYGVGIQHLYKKRHDISAEFFINDDFNMKRPEDLGAIDISYTYHFKKNKGKKAENK